MSTPRPVSADPDVLARFPGYTAAIVVARGLPGGASDGESDARLAQAERAAGAAFENIQISQHVHLQAWRETYGSFGSKPSKFLCSAEALLRRVLKGERLPRINRLVDLYNAISLRHALPAGGEDLDAAVGEVRLAFARGGEPFDAGDPNDPPYAGEVIWRDAEGVTCRRWNWRQCRRTRLTERTRNAYFVLDRLAPYPLAVLRAAAAELTDALEAIGGSEISTEWMGQRD